MSHSQALRIADVRAAARLLGEVRELGAEPTRWRHHMLQGLCALVGASAGVSVEAYGWDQGVHPRLTVLVDLGWETEAQRRNFHEFVSSSLFQSDPQVHARARVGNRDFTLLRPQMVPDPHWYAAPTVSEGRRFAGIDHSMTSGRVLPGGTGGEDEISLHRPWGGRPFGVRERRIVGFFHDELAHLWYRRAARPPGPLERLPRHLRLTLARLLAGRSEKEAARELGLTRQTVHAYARMLYQRLGVTTRAELLVQCLPDYDFLPRLSNPIGHAPVRPTGDPASETGA